MSFLRRLLYRLQGMESSSFQIRQHVLSEDVIHDKVARYGGHLLGGLRKWLEGLMEEMRPIGDAKSARKALRNLGITNPNVYNRPCAPYDGFCSSASYRPLSAVSIRLLTVGAIPAPDSGYNALYAHLDDNPPIGFLLCKVDRSAFLGKYEVGNELKRKLSGSPQ